MSCSYIQQNNLYYRIMIFGFLLNTTWNANLISYLSTHKINMPFDSLEKLLKETNYKVAVHSGTTQESNFKLSSDPIKQKIYIQRIKPSLYDFDSYSGRYIVTFINVFIVIKIYLPKCLCT